MSLRYGKSTGFLQSYGEAGTYERDTFTCQHCNFVVIVQPRCDPADFGGMCKSCYGLICPKCVGRRVCDPIEKMIERMEAGWLAKKKLEEWEKSPVIAIGT